MNKYFVNIKTLEDLKKLYKKLAMLHHPDRGGNLRTMQEINSEYDEMFDYLKKHAKSNNPNSQESETTETPEEYRNIIDSLIGLPNIEIEICGMWIWISGETKPLKDQLKSLGLFWACKKQMWYWRPEERKHKGKSNMSIDDIRNKYGSAKINSSNRYALA